eukprot:s4477_g3.t1
MVVVHRVLLSLLLLCDPLLRASESWGIGGLSSPFLGENGTCPAGETCERADENEGRARGAPSRPGPETQQKWRPWNFSWLVRLSLRMISDAAHTSLEYCGTLCASIGLAARWSYWLATAMVAIFLLQLLIWTCNWVLIPGYRHALALWRYVRGRGEWYEIAQLHGVRVFRPKWYGPRGREEWSSAFVQQEVRGRGDGREPFDLLVTDGTAIARLRHGTLRGRTNRHGFKAECDTVHASSHRYYRNQLEGMECKVHLCAQVPCGQPDDDCLHAVAAAVVPRNTDYDLQDAAGRGPLARCATAAWLCGYSSLGLCGGFWKAVRKCASTAESVAFLVQGKTTPLSLTPCKDAARGDKVKLLPSDAEVSSAEDLKHEDGNLYFACCNHHRALYEGQAAKRTCVFEGCDREVKQTKGHLRLCKLHGAKDERVKLPAKPKAPTLGDPSRGSSAPTVAIEEDGTAACFTPGAASTETPKPKANSGNPATTLGKFLRHVLDGEEELQALKGSAEGDAGPRETWENLKEQASAYVARLPRDYPDLARRAIVRLVTEDCPYPEWTREDDEDPVLGLGRGRRGKSEPSASEELRAVEVLPTPAAPPSASSKPNVFSLYRPKGSESVPLGMRAEGEKGSGRGYTAFAAATRPRHAGAYTDGEPPPVDETTKALQAIAKAVTSKDEAASHDKGKLAAIGKVEERLVFLVRGCDALTVSLGTATVGKELFHSLRATSTQGRPQLRAMQFPVNINNRLAYGLASMSLGGKDTKAIPDYCISAADFPLTSEEEFDNWAGCSDMKLEKRPKPPMTLNAWYRNALREAWAISCVYGTEHYSSFEQAATYLLKLGEEHAYMWPAHAIISVWEELWARYVEELRELDRDLRRAMREEAPSFERIRFFVTAPGDDGEPWLRLPRTFFLEDTLEYFQTDVVPRHNRLLSRACWQVALKRSPNPGLHGGKAGEGTEASESRPAPKTGKTPDGQQLKPLMGPPLSNKEAARALDHRPKDKKGAKYICWDHISHRNCLKPNSCPHSHGPGPKWESLDWSVQLQILRRGGLKSQAKITENQVVERMEAIRKNQATKMQEMVEEGKKLKKTGESDPAEAATNSKVGKSMEEQAPTKRSELDWIETDPAAPPEEFSGIFPTDQEEDMAELLKGPDFEFFQDSDVAKATREATVSPQNDEAVGRMALMKEVDGLNLTAGYGENLQTFLKNHLLLKKEREPTKDLTLDDVRSALERARAEGSPALSTAADEALQGATSQRAGYSPNVGKLSSFTWQDGIGTGSLQWDGGRWDVYDFGDQLQPEGDWICNLLTSPLPEDSPESRQCLLLHCAAGYLHKKRGRIPTLPEVQAHTNKMRAELVGQAMEASRHLGECPMSMPRSEADLRVFVHDLLHWSHDKDYRTLASFPAASLLEYTLHVVRMATDGDLSTEVIVGALSSGSEHQQLHLLVHQGHMRLLVPKECTRQPPVIREVVAAGWECHLEAAQGSEATVRARDYLLCPRCVEPEEVPRRSGNRPPSVLGLHLRPDASDRIGAWVQGPLETHELDDTHWTDQDLRDWLGDQKSIFDQALQRGLDFLEVYAGTARASKAVLKKGGLALHLGLDHGQDFRRAKDLGKALLKRLKPKHLWGSFPCSPFCAWIRLAILRNCDMGPRLKEGRVHLKYTLELADLQVQDERDAHLENPLTSLAWKEPVAVRHLADPRWLRSRLDQCQTGLSSPAGGLHLKPTLIRTTDASMQRALNLVCPREHPHDPVEGSATHLSAMYSPHLADIISDVVLDRLHSQGPVGTKGPTLRGPLASKLHAGLEKACKEYLGFISENNYSKQTFIRGAEMGTKVLQEAGGWEEANRGIRRTWIELHGDHFEGVHSDFFEGLVEDELLAKARENAIWGVSAKYEGGSGGRVQCGPHPSLREHLEEAAQQLWKDASKGRVLLCFDEGTSALEGVVSVAMARVPKMLPDRTVSSKGRVIWDAKPVNAYCDKGRHPPALQPKHEEVARLIVWWQCRFPGVPILLSKKDVSDAFKWVPLRGSDTRLFAADLPGGEFGMPGKTITVIYNSLTFGWCGAPGEYMLYAWLIKLGHAAFHPPQGEWNDDVAFRSLVLMDDAVLIEPKVGTRPWVSVAVMEECTKKALGPGSINAAKDEVEGALETRKLIWGLVYDTENNTRMLPPTKLEKAAFLLHLPEFDFGNKRIPLKLVQELRGNQQFWISVLPSLKPILSATNALLGPADLEGFAQARGSEDEQSRVWVRFWEAIELQRLLVDNRIEWGVRFTHPMTEALSLRELLALPGQKDRIVWASGDATLERLGAVDWTNKQAYSLEVEPYRVLFQEMERQALEGGGLPRRVSRPEAETPEEETKERLMVALTELMAVVLLAASQHALWRGKVVLYMGDNQVVIRWINSRQSKHPFAGFLLQLLAAIEACEGFHIHTAYLRTYHNVVADALTRQEPDLILAQAGLQRIAGPE